MALAAASKLEGATPRMLAVLKRALKDPDEGVRLTAFESLLRLRGEAISEAACQQCCVGISAGYWFSDDCAEGRGPRGA